MKAIVLAAGTGSRLGRVTKGMTKGMVPVNGRKLIDYVFDFIELSLFDHVFVVGGFFYEDFKEYIDSKKINNVKVLQNREFHKGNIFSLFTGLNEFIGDSFLIMNADHIYPPAMYQKMKESFFGITAMCDFDRKLSHDDMKVKLNDNRKSIKAISKQLNEFDCGYIGMTYVDSSRERLYREAADVTVERFGEKAVVENILQVIAEKDDNEPVICDLSGFGWYEVDTVEDLKNTEKSIKNNKNFVL